MGEASMKKKSSQNLMEEGPYPHISISSITYLMRKYRITADEAKKFQEQEKESALLGGQDVR